MVEQTSKIICVGNLKGGVGKSTLCVYLFDYLRKKLTKRNVVLVDTDPQGTSYELMETTANPGSLKHLSIGDRYDGVSMSTLDGILRRNVSQSGYLTFVDTGAGKLGNFSQMMMLCNTLLVPTSMSWADLRPTLDFIKNIDERKDEMDSIIPHVIVVPNRVSPRQKDFSTLTESLDGLNVIMAPPVSDLSAARSDLSKFHGIDGVKGTRFFDEIERLGQFIIDYVISGELDRIYSK